MHSRNETAEKKIAAHTYEVENYEKESLPGEHGKK